MQIKLNGELRETEAATLGQLVASYQLSPEAVVIECNGVIAQKQAWASTSLHNGDQIEIISFVGGG